MSLPRYWDMQPGGDERYGRVLCEEEFLAFFECTLPLAESSNEHWSRLCDEHELPECREPALT